MSISQGICGPSGPQRTYRWSLLLREQEKGKGEGKRGEKGGQREEQEERERDASNRNLTVVM